MSDRYFHEFGRGSRFGRHPRIFKRGDMKYVILDVIKDKSSCGYEITQVLEERFHGLYSPSTGSVYPVLQLLEDMKFVTSNISEGKKVYTISDNGKKFLEDEKGNMDQIKRRLWGWQNSEDDSYLQEVRKTLDFAHDIKQLIRQTAAYKNSEKIARIKEIMTAALKEIELIYQGK